MEHTYMLYRRDGAYPMQISEETIRTLLFHSEITFDHSSHVHKDTYMLHYFKFKD